MSKKSEDAKHVFTYHTRLKALNASDESALAAYATTFGRVERKLFAALEKSKSDASLSTLSPKNAFLKQHGLTSRQYNSVLFGLKGKIDSIKALGDDYVSDLKAKITQAEKVVAKLEVNLANLLCPESAKKTGARSQPKVLALTSGQRSASIRKANFKLHHKRRRVELLRDRLAKRLFAVENNKSALCFGSKKLFNRQFSLLENGYLDAAAFEQATPNEKALLTQQALALWRRDWRNARSNQFFILGSGDELQGCQSCTAVQDENGSLTLRVRMPKQLELTHGKFLTLKGIDFNHGHALIAQAADEYSLMPRNDGSEKRALSTGFKRVGTALSYRFLKDEKGWRVFVSVGIKPKQAVTSKLSGAIGVDINADHLAVTELDRFGNWLDSTRFNLNTYGASADQVAALLGDIAKEIAGKAFHTGKPVIIEKLDFSKKKAGLTKLNPKYARMLSSFIYGKVITMIRSACFKLGVEVIAVNPAYTSTIGAVNFAQRLGISAHQGAAMAIARRGLGFSERPIASTQSTVKNKTLTNKGVEPVAAGVKPVTEPTVAAKNSNGIQLKTLRTSVSPPCQVPFSPCQDGSHVTLKLPARNRFRHVWCQWGKIRSLLKAAHVARVRSGCLYWNPVPLRLIDLSKGTHWGLSAKTRHVNRQDYCSPDVMCSDVPF